jgi:hypothetical protein
MQYVTVRQDGTGTLWIGALAKGGADRTEFRRPMASDLCSGATLTLGMSCTVGVRFQPTQLGPQTATLVIPNGDSDESPITVTLSGTGLGSEVSVAPPALGFGAVAVGGTSGIQSISIHNSGAASLVLGAVTFVTGGAEFVTTSDTCSGQTIGSWQACAMGVQFAPAGPGPRAGVLEVATNDVDESVVSVTLAGTGVGPEVRIAPLAVAFGSLPVGGKSAVQWVTVTNDGPGILGVGTLVLAGPNPAEFRKLVDGCSGRTLASGESCTVGVRFRPAVGGSLMSRLRIPTSDADEAMIKIELTGTGLVP